jgi:hypothetical protein
MRNTVWIVLGLLILGLGGGFLALGAFPPEPKTQTIQRVLPNERFAPKP